MGGSNPPSLCRRGASGDMWQPLPHNQSLITSGDLVEIRSWAKTSHNEFPKPTGSLVSWWLSLWIQALEECQSLFFCMDLNYCPVWPRRPGHTPTGTRRTHFQLFLQGRQHIFSPRGNILVPHAVSMRKQVEPPSPFCFSVYFLPD